MGLSIFDLFKIGIGPSSSHTVGPMVAANRFLDELHKNQLFKQTHRIKADLYGSLAMTGEGHATDVAVLLGLLGEHPDRVNPDKVPEYVAFIKAHDQLKLGGVRDIPFYFDTDLQFHFGNSLPSHPNGMSLTALDAEGHTLYKNQYYSVGGGFVLNEQEASSSQSTSHQAAPIPYPFENGQDLLDHGNNSGLSIAELVLENEKYLGRSQDIPKDLMAIWQVMDECIQRGCAQTGKLPGGLDVERRASEMYKRLVNKPPEQRDDLESMDWVSLFALAVNEENAAGGRVVTAPTNGAAGVIPAVLAYYARFIPGSSDKGIQIFLATAAAIGMLYKKNASISAAEVGCQGEIGVACSMAAGALCAVFGGTNEQIENAAEIGMEHNLGLTCDPVGGLVQVPCIERNTMGAVKAINAARLALQGTGQHRVSLDNVIETMRQTGLDMQDKYKETATGGLAVNVVMC
ncbi:L-serine ammonia-lyase [Endozoicomonas arenosclerae]|uniref:L-serine ammonia-lyase n=1 Tax=Endozoicomonas arenosclerae TaxID=1633495 RepID=UPI0007839932|nr:L-serine ammonia-lyase [Endozoicomonas arenosclerae]